MNDLERLHKAAINLAVANGNLQLAIARDDPADVLKAVHFIRDAQRSLGASLYTDDQLAGLEASAETKIKTNTAYYGKTGASHGN